MRSFHALFAGLVLIGAVTGCRKAQGPIKIACPMIAPQVKAAILAAEEWNEQHAGLGRRVEIVGNDVLVGSPLMAANEIVKSGDYACVVGHLGSHATLIASKVYERGQVVLLAPNATHPDVVRQSRFNFSMCLDDGDEAAFLADQAVRVLRAKRVVVVYENLDYGRDLARSFQSEMANRGVDVMLMLNFGSDTQLPPLIAAAVQRESDLVFCAGQASHAVAVQKLLEKRNSHARVMGGDAIDLIDDLKQFGALDGLLMARLFAANPNFSEFERKYTEKYGASADQASALVYDAVLAVCTVIEHGASTPQEIAANLQKLGNGIEPPTGASGKIQFGPSRKRAQLQLELGEYDAKSQSVVPYRQTLGEAR